MLFLSEHTTASSLSELIKLFAERFRALSGEVHVVSGVEDAAHAVADVVQAEAASCVAIAHLDDTLKQTIRDAIGNRAQLLEDPFPASELPELLDTAQVGVTGVDWGIAETATLVEVCEDDAVRLVSGLPKTHIGILRASTLVHKFTDAAEPMRKALADHPDNCSVSFISGPSRTGDIEMILTLGVHGPERAHAIIIEDR